MKWWLFYQSVTQNVCLSDLPTDCHELEEKECRVLFVWTLNVLTVFAHFTSQDQIYGSTPSKKDRKSGKSGKKEKGHNSPNGEQENGSDEVIEAPPPAVSSRPQNSSKTKKEHD